MMCFSCSQHIDGQMYKCPITYKPPMLTSIKKSLCNSFYTFKQPISQNELNFGNYLQKNVIPEEIIFFDENHPLANNIPHNFCSLVCLEKFIKQNKHKYIFQNSQWLLFHLN